MKKYKAVFEAVTRGALGDSSMFVEIVKAENEEKARIKLYDNYDHIYGITFTEVKT